MAEKQPSLVFAAFAKTALADCAEQSNLAFQQHPMPEIRNWMVALLLKHQANLPYARDRCRKLSILINWIFQ